MGMGTGPVPIPIRLNDEVTMNMAEYTSSWYSAAGAAEEFQYLWDGGGADVSWQLSLKISIYF